MSTKPKDPCWGDLALSPRIKLVAAVLGLDAPAFLTAETHRPLGWAVFFAVVTLGCGPSPAPDVIPNARPAPLPESRTDAPPLVPAPDLAAGDAAYARAMAIDLAAELLNEAHPRAATEQRLQAISRAIAEARALYAREALPASEALVATRVADLLDSMATRVAAFADAVEAEIELDVDIAEPVRATYCAALVSYARALAADPSSERARAQVDAYGESFRRGCMQAMPPGL